MRKNNGLLFMVQQISLPGEIVMKRIVDPYWISFALIIIGLLMIMYSAGESNRVSHTEGNIILAAHSLAGGMIVSSGMISLVILKVFGNNKDEKE